METLVQNHRIAEEGKNERHQERMEMGIKMLEKLDKLIEKM